MLAGKHHDSAVCTLAAVLLTRIAACLRAGTHYLLRDTDGRVITEAQGRAIVAERYTVPPEVRAARRKVTPPQTPTTQRAERAGQDRSRHALQGIARSATSMNRPPLSSQHLTSVENSTGPRTPISRPGSGNG